MMAAATWADLVTTALLGTDRRPVPIDLPGTWAGLVPRDDPPKRVLDLAAQYRAWSRAGTRLQATDPPPRAPATVGTTAPTAAHELLGRLLEVPGPSLINHWLVACVDRGLLVSAEYWQPLAVLAAGSVGYDRRLLGLALGDRGIWFVHQNPAWGRLAAQLTAAMSETTAPVSVPLAMECEQAAEPVSEIAAVFASIDFPASNASETA
jgi:hypothetical protein